MSAGDDWRKTFRPDLPSPARMYNYFLGGKDHFEADRKAAEQVIRQIIDIGTGLPSEGNVHEVAHEYEPDVRVVYVDHDPVVLAHGRNMLNGVPGTAIIGRDLLDSRPREAAAVERIYRGTTTDIHARTRSQVLALLGDDLELIEPGLVWGPSWRPERGVLPGVDLSRRHLPRRLPLPHGNSSLAPFVTIRGAAGSRCWRRFRATGRHAAGTTGSGIASMMARA